MSTRSRAGRGTRRRRWAKRIVRAGSVTTRWAPVSTSTVAWPTQVIVGERSVTRCCVARVGLGPAGVEVSFSSGDTRVVDGAELLTIGEVAERTGVAPSALRFYERQGLVHAERSDGGQRRYAREVLRRIAFIRVAQRVGLSLDEISELLALLGDDECAPVQGRLRDLVDTKIADAQAKVAELEAFTLELRRVAVALGTHTPAGPCDDTCGCTSDGPTTADQPVLLGMRRDDRDGSVIACTLLPHEVGDRLGTAP